MGAPQSRVSCGHGRVAGALQSQVSCSCGHSRVAGALQSRVSCGNGRVAGAPHSWASLCFRLRPFTSYKLRLKATNDIGDSDFSVETEAVTTLQDGEPAAPSTAPRDSLGRLLS